MMNRNRKIALVLFIITFLAAVWLLKCSDTEQAPVKDPTEERRHMKPEKEPGDWYQETGNPPPVPEQPPD